MRVFCEWSLRSAWRSVLNVLGRDTDTPSPMCECKHSRMAHHDDGEGDTGCMLILVETHEECECTEFRAA